MTSVPKRKQFEELPPDELPAELLPPDVLPPEVPPPVDPLALELPTPPVDELTTELSSVLCAELLGGLELLPIELLAEPLALPLPDDPPPVLLMGGSRVELSDELIELEELLELPPVGAWPVAQTGRYRKCCVGVGMAGLSVGWRRGCTSRVC